MADRAFPVLFNALSGGKTSLGCTDVFIARIKVNFTPCHQFFKPLEVNILPVVAGGRNCSGKTAVAVQNGGAGTAPVP